MADNQAQVIVLGVGYAGLLATVRLAGKTRGQNVAITLVNSSDTFVERLRLHQFAANQPIAQRPISNVLNRTGVNFLQGWATTLDAARHQVIVQSGAEIRRIGFDKMIYALGSTIDRDSVAAIREYAYTLTPPGPRSAAELRQVLPALNAAGGRVLICGGGATGIEKDFLGQVFCLLHTHQSRQVAEYFGAKVGVDLPKIHCDLAHRLTSIEIGPQGHFMRI